LPCPAPLIVSLGDPAGIGPEIIGQAWDSLRHDGPVFAVAGDSDLLECLGFPVRVLTDIGEALDVFPTSLPVLHSPVGTKVSAGKPDPSAAPAIIGWIRDATLLCLSGKAAGLVTAPIAKANLYSAGFAYPGHTEYLGFLTSQAPHEGARGPVMMLAVEGLRTTLVTIHQPLADVPASLSRDRIIHAGLVTAQALKRDFGISNPRIAVAGLNPHAGENGTIGREEIDLIAPAIAQLKTLGVNASGPYPADSLFTTDHRQTYDAAVCMYHDQALIPVKMLDFWGGVNVSLGLPVVRTSPDHGTAFNIAGTGTARPASMIAAIRMARAIADCRSR